MFSLTLLFLLYICISIYEFRALKIQASLTMCTPCFHCWLHEGRALVFDLISFIFLMLLCWSAALKTWYQPASQYSEIGKRIHCIKCDFVATVISGFLTIFVYCHCWDILSQAWIGCNWQQNGIACIAIFGCLHTSPPKLKTRTGPKVGNEIISNQKEKKTTTILVNPIKKYVTYSLSVYARSVMTPVELSRPKQLLVNIFY